MSTNVRVRVPKALIEQAAQPSNTVKALLEQALSLGLTPVHTTSVLCMYVSVYLGSSLASDIELSVPNDPIARTCQGLLAALFLHQKNEQKTADKVENGSKSINDYFDARPEQSVLFEQVKTLFAHKEALGIFEASTGVGKGRVLMASALYAYEITQKPVVICAPTIQILSQLCNEYLAVDPKAREFIGNKLCILLGKDNFVSEHLLKLWLDTEEEITDSTRVAIDKWLREGAGQTSHTTSALHTLMPQVKYLVADAKEVAPQVPWDELITSQLGADDDADAGYQCYLNLRQNNAQSAVLTLATHSMVVMDTVLRKRNGTGLFAPFSTLIVDEAHALAGIVESSFSKYGAIRSIIAELSNVDYWKRQRKSTVAQQAIGKVKGVGEELRVLLKSCNAERINLNQSEHRETFAQCISNLQASLSPLISSAPLYSKVTEAFELCKELNKGRLRVDLVASPVRGYPSIQGGPTNLTGFFAGFWESVDHVVLASATCYVPGVNGQLNSGLLVTSLNLTKRFGIEGVKKFSPVIPAWLYQSVQLIESRDPALRYPAFESDSDEECASDFEEQLSSWHEAVAKRIRYIHGQAAGGTLVLLPSYESIAKLSTLLTDISVITQSVGTFADCHREFKQAYKEGRKTVWLATGSAWTGLDCSDTSVSADKDLLLTDLVIPKVPFGVERSLAHLRRQKTLPTAERDRALFQFKQGVGRLIRRPGLLHRKLWILDSRINGVEKPWLYKPFQTLIAQYSNRMTLEPV